jgi:hypothetical protein
METLKIKYVKNTRVSKANPKYLKLNRQINKLNIKRREMTKED